MPTVITGIEQFIYSPPKWVFNKKMTLLCNPASVDRKFRHTRELINNRFPGQLTALLSPQHGFFAAKQDNMKESDDIQDPLLKIPVFSLYGKTRIPTSKMLAETDILIIDLQDVGTRVYTFIYTMSYCLEAAKQFGIKVIILDRPNPLGGNIVQGNCLQADCTSFVGRYPIPMRHGLTIGELANLFNEEYGIGCDLTIIPMKNWKRSMFFQNTLLQWVAPSPNLPTPSSAQIYPGQVIWEGTNVSEGRGTSQPFELFGAPFLNCDKILTVLGSRSIDGAVLRPLAFEPTSGKWAGHLCNGFQIHILNPRNFDPYRLSLKLLRSVLRLHGNHFQWKPPPYEYEYNRLPIDLILGDREIRNRLENLDKVEDIEASWQDALHEFRVISESFHLYE